MVKNKVLILGSNGLVGSSLNRILEKSENVEEVIASTRKDTDLFNFDETKKLIEYTKPNILINAAAKVGGIYANNTKRSDFILDNLKINLNILENCIPFPEIKIINLGSSCIYPLDAENPIKEESIMSGNLEPTNSPYAMAKLTAIEMSDAMSKQHGHSITNIMPTNLYGPNDNFSITDSHVIPGLIHRMYNAKKENNEVFKIWGSGKPLREFLFVDDLSKCIDFIIKEGIDKNLINVGSGIEISILDLTKLIQAKLEYKGELLFDKEKPDGNPRKLLDSSLINSAGWSHQTSLDEGLSITIKWFKENIN